MTGPNRWRVTYALGLEELPAGTPILTVKSLWRISLFVTLSIALSFAILCYFESEHIHQLKSCRFRSGESSPLGTNRDYVVHTSGCRISDFAPFEENFLHFFHGSVNESFVDCNPNKKGLLVKSTTTQLYVDESIVSKYVNKSYHLKCCYKPFVRRMMAQNPKKNVYRWKVDNKVKYSQRCHRFRDPTTIKHQFVLAICRDLNHWPESEQRAIVYFDYFTFAVDQPLLDQPTTAPSITDNNVIYHYDENDDKFKSARERNPYNVLILGFDGLSRLNFLREMPRTASFLEENGGVSLLGYNKVGYNTFPNLMPVLTGLNVRELRNMCWPNSSRSVLDDCPFIWKEFSAKGYYTAYGEDNPAASTFSYQKRGFRKQPTDYYLRPYFIEAEHYLRVTKLLNWTSICCIGYTPNHERLENVIKGFASNMKDRPTFGLFWLNGLSHDYLNLPRLVDKSFRETLDFLKLDGALESTVLIALSDHGIRWGRFRQTFQGYMEERLPLATIVLPENFKNKFPEATKNLNINSRRLTTPYDLHETLLNILHPSRLPDRVGVNSFKRYTRSLSVFYQIPTGRTCAVAGIPPNWCACSDLRKIEGHEELATSLAKVVLTDVNSAVNTDLCAELELKNITALWEEGPYDGGKDFKYQLREYMIQFETKPGSGFFEARIQRVKTGKYQVLGTISRLSMYENDSYCVDDEIMKLYCYCVNASTQQPELQLYSTLPMAFESLANSEELDATAAVSTETAIAELVSMDRDYLSEEENEGTQYETSSDGESHQRHDRLTT